MNIPSIAALVIGGLCLPALAFADETEVNLLSWDQAARVIGKPLANANDGNWSADAILDELVDTGWSSPAFDLKPKDLVFELGTKSSISRVVFDTAQTYNPERAAKDIVVAISDAADGGFAPILKVALAKAKDGQLFVLPKPAVGRYVKLTVLDNFGDPKFLQVMNIKAYGKALLPMKTPDISGTYDTPVFNSVHLQQKGSAVSGCYEHAGGLLPNGAIEGRVLRIAWSTEAGPTTRNRGMTLFIFAEDGKSFTGHYWWDGKDKDPRPWNGTRASSDIGSCPYWKPDGHNEVEQQLKTDGRVRLYGILFDTDSEHIKSESKPTIDALVGAAKNQPTWSFAIEGHTDNVGGDAHNQLLSAKRADAVKAYLVKAGVDVARLSTQGFGATRPVASNDTSIGRAQNRRVEIVKR